LCLSGVYQQHTIRHARLDRSLRLFRYTRLVRHARLRPGISFTLDGTTFKGSSLDRSLSFSKIDKVLTGGVNIDTGGQAQDPSVNESRSKDQDHSLTTDLSMLAADLAIGFIASGQEKKSEEQDLAPNKKRGPRL